MRATLLMAVLLPGLFFATLVARSDEPPPAEDKAAATQAAAETAAASAAADEDKLVLPSGFKPKRRGKFTLYCKREEVLGSRFPAEKCYDEEGIRAMLRAQLEDREKVDQMRRICGSMDACGGGG